jgi:hypothetical protein
MQTRPSIAKKSAPARRAAASVKKNGCTHMVKRSAGRLKGEGRFTKPVGRAPQQLAKRSLPVSNYARLSRRTLADIEEATHNLRAGKVSAPVDYERYAAA